MKTLVISDFSKTFTTDDMPTIYSVFAKSGLLGPEYTAARDALYAERHHYELEGNKQETQRWFHDHVELFADYHLTQALIDRIVADDSYFLPRAGVAEFLAYARGNDIPVRIVTSGIADFVEAFFRMRGYSLDGIEVYGNRFILEDGKVIGVDRSVGITGLDKSAHPFGISEYDKIILLGDNRGDCQLAQ